MRILFILATSFIICFSLNGQRITASYYNEPLYHVLNQIRDDYDVKFAYDNDLVNDITVSGSFQDAAVDEVLVKILTGTPLTFRNDR